MMLLKTTMPIGKIEHIGRGKQKRIAKISIFPCNGYLKTYLFIHPKWKKILHNMRL